jgi:hypothetical protein
MMRSPAMRTLASVVWVITSLAAIHIGLSALGYNVFASPMLGGVSRPVEYLIGIAGVISFAFLVMHSGCCWCGGWKENH